MTGIEIVLLAALGAVLGWTLTTGLVLTITMIAAHHDDDRHHGPLMPVLDADGLPVVHTVGDLTARHQLARPRIRVAGREGKLWIVKPSDAYPGTVTLIWGDCWEDAALEEPCEVLP